MPSYRDKVTVGRLYEVNVQPTDTHAGLGQISGHSVSNTLTVTTNPMVGPKLWDRVAYMIGYSANAGSHTVTLYGKVNGTTYPIARHIAGRPTAATGRFVMDNITNTPYTPAPLTLEIDETTNGDVSFRIDAIGKAYRGFYPGRCVSGDKTIEGALIGETAVTVSTTHNLSSNPAAAAGGASGARFGGLEKLYMWDAACFYYETVATTNGSWTVDIISNMNGQTVSVARATGINGATKGAFQSLCYGAVPTPVAIIFTEDSAGTWTGKIDFIAKANRGQKIGGR